MSITRACVAILSFVSLGVLIFLYVNYTPWVMARSVSELSLYDSAPSASSDHVSFSVNRGEFTFYDDSPQTNKSKLAAIVLAGAISSLFFIVAGLSQVTRIKRAAMSDLRQDSVTATAGTGPKTNDSNN